MILGYDQIFYSLEPKVIIKPASGGEEMKQYPDSMRLDIQIPITEIMRTNPTVIGINATVAEAAAAMCRDEVGSCIVLKGTIPIGIITEQDINCKVVAKDLKPGVVKVHEVMTQPLITINSAETVEDAAHMMVKKSVRRLPVVDDKNCVIGIITVRDLLATSTEINDVMQELVEVNRDYSMEMSVCDRCGQMSDDLEKVDNVFICASCRDEDRL